MEEILVPKIGDTLYTEYDFVEDAEGKVYGVDFDEECKVYRVAIMWHYDDPCSSEYDAGNYTQIDYGPHTIEDGLRYVKTNMGIWYYDKEKVLARKRQSMQDKIEGFKSLITTLEKRLSGLGKEPNQLREGNPIYGYLDRLEEEASIVEYKGQIVKVTGAGDYKEVIFTYGNEHSKHAEIGMKCPWHSHIISDNSYHKFFLSERDMLETCIEKSKTQLAFNRQLLNKKN